MGWVVNAMPRPFYLQEEDPLSIVQEAGWTPEPVWAIAENLAPAGIRSSGRPTLSEKLYRLIIMRYTKCLSSLINQLFRITLTSISCYFCHKDKRKKAGKLLTKRCSSPTQMIFHIFPVNFALVDLLPFRMCLCLSA